jgi:hypothetical protein
MIIRRDDYGNGDGRAFDDIAPTVGAVPDN